MTVQNQFYLQILLLIKSKMATAAILKFDWHNLDNTAVKWHSAVNHVSQVLALRRGFAGNLTLRHTSVTRFVYLDNNGSSVLQPILSKITI